MTLLADHTAATLAVIRADAEAIEHAMREGRVTDPETALPAVLVHEIAQSNSQAYALPGGMGALIATDYDADPCAFAVRIVRALAASARLHGAEDLLPLLTGARLALATLTDADRLADALLLETAGEGIDGA